MSLRRTLVTLAAPAALLSLGACTTPFRADVTRFQMMPPPAGQTFLVQAADPMKQGGIEFAQYANMVATRLAQQGYRPVESGPASLIVTLDYGVDNGHEKVTTYPGFGYGGFGYGGLGYGGFGRGFYGGGFYGGGFGGFGGFGYGGFGPYGGWGYPDVESYTYFVSHLTMQVRRAGDGRMLFEGRARARSTSDNLPNLVPNLVEAMFTGFPGRSGEDVMITVPPPPKQATVSSPTRGYKPINPGSL